MKTDNDANNSHIEINLFPRHLPSLATPFLVNRNDYWIVGYWLSTYVLVLHDIIYIAAKNKHVYRNFSRQTVQRFGI